MNGIMCISKCQYKGRDVGEYMRMLPELNIIYGIEVWGLIET
jgi:hypothetical protein